MKVFIIAFCIVGWGEIAQYVRGQVIAEKPKLHIEAAHAVGARSGRILNIHILPPPCCPPSLYWPYWKWAAY